ncbi:hypothetical protein CVT24_009675 [Panaeolus cyanescens]|uniref:Uncharacterized protein n=1 Tax=Panaeolus cyanescens TaxID=181874 RepID=A0A409Y9G9_9AGAR|nr:hypothetical protein CVT24_009675 [Panaeolus cyanescens]
MDSTSSTKPILIEFAPASRPPRPNHASHQSWSLPSPQATSTSQVYSSSPIRREPIILTYRSPLRRESESLLETDAATVTDILEVPRAKDEDETRTFVHPTELHHLLPLDDEWTESGAKNPPPTRKAPRRIFGWALSSNVTPSSSDRHRRRDSIPAHAESSHTRRLKAPFLAIVAKRKPSDSVIAELQKSTDAPRRNTWSSSNPKSFHISSLPSLILPKREHNLSSPTLFSKKKKTVFQPEPIEPPERRPLPPPLPLHLRQDVAASFDEEIVHWPASASLIDSLSLDSSLEYDDDEYDSSIVAFGPEVLLEDGEEASSTSTIDDSVTEPEEAITPSSSHPYALVGLPSNALLDEVRQEGEWNDVVVLEHTLEEFVLANPISVKLKLPLPRRRSSCPSLTSSKKRPRSNRSHHRPNVPLRLPRSVSSTGSIKQFDASQSVGSQRSSSPQVDSAPEGRLQPPLLVEQLLDDSDADFLDLQESVYSRTLSYVSRRESFLSDNREDFLDLGWSSAGEDSSLRIGR